MLRERLKNTTEVQARSATTKMILTEEDRMKLVAFGQMKKPGGMPTGLIHDTRNKNSKLRLCFVLLCKSEPQDSAVLVPRPWISRLMVGSVVPMI